jgi:hypothetical protein
VLPAIFDFVTARVTYEIDITGDGLDHISTATLPLLGQHLARRTRPIMTQLLTKMTTSKFFLADGKAFRGRIATL